MYFQRYKCYIISYQNIWSINLCSRLYLVGLDIQVANQMSLITTFLHFEKRRILWFQNKILPLSFSSLSFLRIACRIRRMTNYFKRRYLLVCFSERVQKPLSFNGFCSDEIPYLQLAAVVNFKNVLSKRSCTKVLKGSKKEKIKNNTYVDHEFEILQSEKSLIECGM